VIVRLADTACDCADVNIAEIDVPAVLAFGIAAAGEGGHPLLKRGGHGIGKPLRLAG
jgi:hypothetical protein